MEAHAGEYHEKKINAICVREDSRISFSSKLAPFQYQEYKYGLFHGTLLKVYSHSEAW